MYPLKSLLAAPITLHLEIFEVFYLKVTLLSLYHFEVLLRPLREERQILKNQTRIQVVMSLRY